MASAVASSRSIAAGWDRALRYPLRVVSFRSVHTRELKSHGEKDKIVQNERRDVGSSTCRRDINMNPAIRLPLSAIALLLLPCHGNAQSVRSARPDFTAATVKPGRDGEQIIRAALGLLTIEHATLRFIITMAYGVRPGLISGGPGWLDSELGVRHRNESLQVSLFLGSYPCG